MYKILIVEDEFAIRSSLVHHFEDYEYIVYAVESAEEGKILLEKNEFDGVIVDLRLPGLSGDQFILDVYDKTENTVFIIHSGSTDYKMQQKLSNLKRVSSIVFRKPLPDLNVLNEEIDSMIKNIEKN